MAISSKYNEFKTTVDTLRFIDSWNYNKFPNFNNSIVKANFYKIDIVVDLYNKINEILPFIRSKKCNKKLSDYKFIKEFIYLHNKEVKLDSFVSGGVVYDGHLNKETGLYDCYDIYYINAILLYHLARLEYIEVLKEYNLE